MHSASLSYALSVHRPTSQGVPLRLNSIRPDPLRREIVSALSQMRTQQGKELHHEDRGCIFPDFEKERTDTEKLSPIPNIIASSSSVAWDEINAVALWKLVLHMKEREIKSVEAVSETRPCAVCGQLGQWHMCDFSGWFKHDQQIHDIPILTCNACIEKARALPVRPRKVKRARAPARKRKAAGSDGEKRKRAAPNRSDEKK